jgi:uncharacterized protein YbbC (DUF1343 family)
MRFTFFRSIFLFLLCISVSYGNPIRLGIDRLEQDGFEVLDGKRIGLVAHPASVNSSMIPTADILLKTDRCKLVALFGPEHGVYGNEYAGVEIGNRTDQHTGLPIYSLYGKTRKPTSEMLKNLDALVFDLQDIGSRSYTYISTMKLCLEACADAGIHFVILDRPNPLGGDRIEGPMVEKGFESFVSALPIPYVHGLTMGELAQMMKESIAPHYEKLHVLKMSGWKRDMVWSDTGLNWIPTSPHIPSATSCAAYAATGILGELDQVSVGVGYPQPFEIVGAPWVHADLLADSLNTSWNNPRAVYKKVSTPNSTESKSAASPQGLLFRSARFKPFYAIFKDTPCEGVQLYLDPKSAENLVEVNFRILSALDAAKLFRDAGAAQVSMFDKVTGTNEARKWLVDGRDLETLFSKWKDSSSKFREVRKPFLLY